MARFVMGQRALMVALMCPLCVPWHVPDAAVALWSVSVTRAVQGRAALWALLLHISVRWTTALGTWLSHDALCQPHVL